MSRKIYVCTMLLKIKAKDKLYIPHESDSLIKSIVQYYEGYGTPDQLMEAYYYLGSAYRDMGDAPRAVRAFQDAADIGKDSKRYDILGRVYDRWDIDWHIKVCGR